MPGTGEYALATDAGLHYEEAPGRDRAANVNTPRGQADFVTSLDALEEELPNCEFGLAGRVVVRRRPALRFAAGSSRRSSSAEHDAEDALERLGRDARTAERIVPHGRTVRSMAARPPISR